MTTCKCGREYEPKQWWIHNPVCRYVDAVNPNHVGEGKRGYVNGATAVNSPVVSVNTKDRAAYMREYMRQKRAAEKAGEQTLPT